MARQPAFIVGLRGPGDQMMYYALQADGSVLLTPNRDKATPLPEVRADMLVVAHNLYTLDPEADAIGTQRPIPDDLPGAIAS